MKLLTGFVTVADEVGRLQRGGNAESDVFNGFCEQGHYGGRTQPTGTRQGIYAVAPSGKFLASVNTRSPKRVAVMLRTALERWQQMPAEDRALDEGLKQRMTGTKRFEDRYPEDGLVLAQYSRDLKESVPEGDWRARAWNEDQAWFTRGEAQSMVPEKFAVGARIDVPERLVVRLACLHLVDSVRGQTPAYKKDDLVGGWLRTEVVGIAGDRLSLQLSGQTHTEKKGRWQVRDRGSEPIGHERGIKTEFEGRAVWNRKSGRFVSFELLAIGERWGATQYNGRPADLEPTPIGFAFVLAPKGHPKVAPAFWWRYELK